MDTVKILSDELETQIEHSRDTNDGWVYCKDGQNMPEEHNSIFAKFKDTDKWNDYMFEKISDEVNVTIEYKGGKRDVTTLCTIDGKWHNNEGVVYNVIAWKPLPEYYRGDR